METTHPLKVLIAEDEDTFRMVLQRVILSNKNYEFEACASGDEVIERLREKHYDVIILDHKMPGRSGLNILQWMLEQKVDIPVIMLTGAGSENIAVEAMKLGAYDYIRKEQFEKEHLPQIINSAHERHMFRKERALRERILSDQSKSTQTFELISRCIHSFEELMNSSLVATRGELDTQEKEIVDILPAQSAKSVSESFSRIRHQHEMVEFCTKLLVELSRLMFERLTATVTNDQQQKELRQLLERIIGFSKEGDTP